MKKDMLLRSETEQPAAVSNGSFTHEKRTPERVLY